MLDIGPASVARQNVLKTQLKQAGVDNDTAVLRLTRQLLQYLLQHDSKSATAVFATTADLQTATTILTNHLENLKHE